MDPMQAVRAGRGHPPRRQNAIEAAYDHLRLDRQGSLVSANTLGRYDFFLLPFLEWLRQAHPQVERFDDLDVAVVRRYRAELVTQTSRRTGRRLEPPPSSTATG
jgi:hypothetical protein